MRRLLRCLPLLLLVAGAAVAQPVSHAALRARLQTALDSAHAAGSFPGATVGVALGDGTSFGLATGLANRAAGTLMQPTDRLMQGSVGKTYAAAVALQLLLDGTLKLDEPVSTYLGARPWYGRLPNASTMTVRQLMTHTSGLKRYEFEPRFLADLNANPDRHWAPESLLAYVFGHEAAFPAGQGWNYSDTNYIVLGLVLEAVTGRPYFETLRTRLLGPLGLTGTVPVEGRVVPGLAQGYAGAGNDFVGTDEVIGPDGKFVINPQFEWTGGGVASTAEDLATWAHALYSGRVTGPDGVQLMLDAAVPARLGRDTRYGLGVIVRPTPLGTAVGHSGFFPGYMSEVLYFPDLGAALSIQVNTSVPSTLGGPLVQTLLNLACHFRDAG